MRLAITMFLGVLLAAAGNGLQAQTKPAPAGKPAGKAAAKGGSGAKKAPRAPKPAAAAGEPADAEGKVSRRDPFESLVGREKAQAELSKNLPPGKAGLQVASLRLDGIVRAPNGMIAVVTNP